MDREQQDMMYERNYSSAAGSRMGSNYSGNQGYPIVDPTGELPYNPHDEEMPVKSKGALRDKLENIEESLRTITDDVNYHK